MVIQHKRPFSEELRKIRISFVANSTFPTDEAVVCDGVIFFNIRSTYTTRRSTRLSSTLVVGVLVRLLPTDIQCQSVFK
jgi:hypothetical protein